MAHTWMDAPWTATRRWDGYDSSLHTPTVAPSPDILYWTGGDYVDWDGDLEGFRRDVRSVARHGLDRMTFRKEWLQLVDRWTADDADAD